MLEQYCVIQMMLAIQIHYRTSLAKFLYPMRDCLMPKYTAHPS